ncbi:MAG: hypothetical protein LBQ09_06545 [Acidobacteriaceae bacterium]|jgi:hypothetical protein|nr:hypothetical protein [Acidobacteriaceae bacterium]
MFYRCASILVAGALLMSACGGVISPTTNHNDNVSGTIPFGGAAPEHVFTVGKTGEYSITINSLTPPTGSLIGVGFGLEQSGVCNYLTTTYGQIGRPALNSSISSGTYCVQLYDLGTLKQDETYTMTISYP